MKFKINVAFLVIVAALQSCIPSVHQLYTEDTVRFDEDLLGLWVEQDAESVATNSAKTPEKDNIERSTRTPGEKLLLGFSKFIDTLSYKNYGDAQSKWLFEKKGAEGYQLTHYTAKGASAVFEAHLVEINGLQFLDFYPDSNRGSLLMHENEFLQMHVFPVHTFAKVEIKTEEVRVYMINYEWIDKLIRESKIRIKHEKVDDEILITAKTESLQKFMAKYGREKEAYIDPIIWKRPEKISD